MYIYIYPWFFTDDIYPDDSGTESLAKKIVYVSQKTTDGHLSLPGNDKYIYT